MWKVPLQVNFLWISFAELIKQPSLWGNAMARLSAAEVTELQTIGASTRTLEGTATSEPCWSWALYGGGTPRDPVDLFAIANVDNLAQSLGAPGLRGQLLTAAIAQSRLPGRLTVAELTWAQRQNAKFRRGGKYTVDYLFEKIVKRAIDRAGLKVADAPGDYFVCMHAPTADNITYEHWWLEVHGYTIEKITLWRAPYIYQRGPEAEHYRAVRIPVTGHQCQVDKIVSILRSGTDKATERWS